MKKLATKTIIILAVAALAAILIGSVAAQYLQSITNNHTATISNPQPTINIFYNGVNCTDGRQVDWGIVTVGENRLELNVTNLSDKTLKITVFIHNLSSTFTITWGLNNSGIFAYGTSPYMAVANLTLTVPDTVPDASTLDFNIEVTATQV